MTWNKAFILGARIWIFAMGLLMGLAHAGEDALYGPVAPKGSAFIRVFNATGADLQAHLGDAVASEVPAYSSSEYAFLPQGSYSPTVGTQNLAVALQEDHYYTLVATGSGPLQLIEDSAFKSRKKALVSVYNLTPAALTLKTADGKTAVIDAIAAKARAQREVNAVKVSLALFQGAQKVEDLEPVVLERGKVFSLFVTGDAGSPSAIWNTSQAAN